MGIQAVDPRDILGGKCYIGGDIPAVINGVLFRVNGSTEYEIVWWDGRTRRCEWVMPQEIQLGRQTD